MTRLVVDRQRLSEAGVIDVRVDAGLAENFKIEIRSPGSPASIVFGPATFDRSNEAASVVHTIAHAYEDARLRREGIDPAIRAFLTLRLEILSRDKEDESLGDIREAFIKDAAAALDAATTLTFKQRKHLRTELREVQNRVPERFQEIDQRTLRADELKLQQDWASFSIP